MALKIFTGAKPFLKAGIKPFGITEIRMLTMEETDFHKLSNSCKMNKIPNDKHGNNENEEGLLPWTLEKKICSSTFSAGMSMLLAAMCGIT
jgi:hypothetical protein